MNRFTALGRRPRRGVSHVPDAPALALAELTVRYGDHVALEGVSFELATGQRLAAVGPNGAGKSTLFKAIAGLVTPSNGTVRVHGRRPGRHHCIAYVPQRSQVDWTFPVNVQDVVMMGRIAQLGLLRRPGRRDRDVVRACMEAMRVDHLAKRQIGELSGGQQQRMAIARALAQEAALVLMDEPLSGLDVNSQNDILDILDTLQAQDVTVIVALHDLDLAASHFDQVLLLNRRALGCGPPAEVFTEARLRSAYGGALNARAEGTA